MVSLSGIFRTEKKEYQLTDRLIEINIQIRTRLRQIEKNVENEKKLNQVAGQLEENEKKLEVAQINLQGHVKQFEVKKPVAARNFHEAQEEVKKLESINRRLNAEFRINLGEFKEMIQIAEANKKLQTEIEQLTAEGEQLIQQAVARGIQLHRAHTQELMG